jgi:hypothetical protein
MGKTEKPKYVPVITGDLETIAKSLPPGAKLLGTKYDLQKAGLLPPGIEPLTPEEFEELRKIYED